ncbi:DUF4940 domain-containing protein [Thermotoga sp. SG1]|uniref:DUF4940 domain-containing protein n=1 Tax=Thermotoga sp. SG1 TaxID=126739 RepID=UPI000CC47871|nr:DUF4940 domain-containing protein [Thermotoga sp. SG1]PLV56847.1 hypothetical protein AS006_04430 [Thermotoga sp. SG1]
MLRLPERITVCDGEKILWNGLGLSDSFIFETTKTVLESNVPVKGSIYCFPAKTILGKMAVFVETKIEPWDLIVELLNHEFLKTRWYNEEVEKVVEILSENWRPGKRVFVVQSEGFESRLLLREELSLFVDAVYNAGSFDVGVSPSNVSFRKTISEGRIAFSDPEKEIREAVRKALMMTKYVEQNVSFYERLYEYSFTKVPVSDTVRIFLRTGDVSKTADSTKKSEEEVFKEILKFEQDFLISPRIPLEAFVLLREG